MEQKTLKMRDILIALAITAVIAIIAISIQNGIKNKSQISSMLTRYKSALTVQVQIADKNINWKYDEKISGNMIYIYFYAEDTYTKNNYGDGYFKINLKTNTVDISSDTDKLRKILVKAKNSI